MRVLLTGGAGYIGSHTAIALFNAGHEPVVLDDLSNSSRESLERVSEITSQPVPFVEGDARDTDLVANTIQQHSIHAVVHFASLKSPSESISDPLRYYRVNLDSALSVLEAMETLDIERFVFSSSAAVYETPGPMLREDSAAGLEVANPYGRTKAMIESIIADVGRSRPKFQATILRYFNPVGAHESGLIGEDPQDIPNNLFPYITQVAVGQRQHLQVFGDDYETPDGTGVRDYIHVMDLAEGHVAALHALEPGIRTVNLGTGRGASVMEAVQAFEAVSGQPIAKSIVGRREGDVPIATADPALASQLIGWQAKRTFTQAVEDAWRWQSLNPRGYSS